MFTRNILLLILLLYASLLWGQRFTISGQITDAVTGEDLISATVYESGLEIGATSNVYGFYSLTTDSGSRTFVFSYLGYQDVLVELDLISDVVKNIELYPNTELIDEVVVTADQEKQEQHESSTEMSAIEVDIETVKKLPALFGEVDIIKAIQLMPGVVSVGEGSSGFYVRGGNVDQNLVLLDEAPIYNASHVLGFFSSFNPDAIRDMKLYKGAIPAYYGGRLSSVLDIRMKEGNAKRFGLSGGIGTIMSRLAVEAPLGNRGSFMIAGRRSYIDVVANAIQALRGKNEGNDNEFYFYDLNAKGNYRINNNNRLFVSGYFGRDVLGEEDDDEKFGLAWGNSTATLRWNHIFSPKLFSNLTYYYSNYNYFLDFEEDISRFKWNSRLREHSVKADFGAYLNPDNTLRFGLHIIDHDIAPGDIESFERGERLEEFQIQENRSIESALYINNETTIGDRFKIDYGARLSTLSNIGPIDEYRLDDEYQVTDTVEHASGIYNTYWNIEPRIGMRYSLGSSGALKASYNRTAQYIQLASNGNTATPFDIWFTSSPEIKPQLADQWALGYFKSFSTIGVKFSLEGYYKKFKNAIDFKDHAQLLLNDNLEGDLRLGQGRSYGVELMAKKTSGRLSGWISYTYSRVQKQIATINNDQWYNAKYDKPHDISVVASYAISDRVSIGSNFVYSTGNAVTFPTGKYDFLGVAVPVYSERNAARLPNYHRLDFSLTLQGKRNKSRRFQTETVFSIYNAYNRRNAFSIDFKQDEINPRLTYAERTAVFSIVPSVTYNVKF